MLIDNKSGIAIASNLKINQNTKHIDVKLHFIKDHVVKLNNLTLHHVPTGEMTADILTKNLSYRPYSKPRSNLGLRRSC